MNRKKVIQSLPIMVLALVIFYTWYNILTTDYFATLKHQIAAFAFIVNIALYRISFKSAIIFTGVFLLLASFSVLAIWPDIVSSSYFIKVGSKELSTPEIQWRTFFILLLYFFCNATFFIDSYAEKKANNL